MRHAFKLLVSLVALAALTLAGCAAPTRVVTNRAADYAGNPKRIFAISSVGNEFGSKFAEGFEQRLGGYAKDCGAEFVLSHVHPLELDREVHTKRMQGFAPDVLLVIHRVGGTKNQYGAIIDAVYDAQLIEQSEKRIVWRAHLKFHPGLGIARDERGAMFATDLMNKLREDRILRECAGSAAAR